MRNFISVRLGPALRLVCGGARIDPFRGELIQGKRKHDVQPQ